MVNVPISSPIIYKQVNRECAGKLEDQQLLVDLVPLHIQEFDAILGMDWLSCHHTTVDYCEKLVKFRQPGKPKLIFRGEHCLFPSCVISTIVVEKLLRKGYQAYLA